MKINDLLKVLKKFKQANLTISGLEVDLTLSQDQSGAWNVDIHPTSTSTKPSALDTKAKLRNTNTNNE